MKLSRLVRLAPLFCVLLVVVVGLAVLNAPQGRGDGAQASTPTPRLPKASDATALAQHPPTPLPTVTPDAAWVTVQHFSGYDSQKTPLFAVSGTWRIVWTCTPAQVGVRSGLSARLLDSNGQEAGTVALGGNYAVGNIYEGYALHPERVSLDIEAIFMSYDFTVQEQRPAQS